MPNKGVDAALFVEADSILNGLTLGSIGDSSGRVVHEVGAQDGGSDAKVLLHPFQTLGFLLTGEVVRAVLGLDILEELPGARSGSLVDVVVGQPGDQRRGEKGNERLFAQHFAISPARRVRKEWNE